MTRDSEEGPPRGVSVQSQVQLPHPYKEEEAPGSRAHPLSPCPLSQLGRAAGRDQDTAGLSRARDRPCLGGRTPAVSSCCPGSVAWSRPAAGALCQCPPSLRPHAGVSLAMPACAQGQHSLTRVSVHPEPLPGALLSSLSTLWVTYCCSQPSARRVPHSIPRDEPCSIPRAEPHSITRAELLSIPLLPSPSSLQEHPPTLGLPGEPPNLLLPHLRWLPGTT